MRELLAFFYSKGGQSMLQKQSAVSDVKTTLTGKRLLYAQETVVLGRDG